MPQKVPFGGSQPTDRSLPLHTSDQPLGADRIRVWDQNRDGHFDARRELFGPYRSPGESMGLTAVVLLAVGMASSYGALLIANLVSGVALHPDDSDPWAAGLGMLILAALVGAATVPIAATVILHTLRVPRPGIAMLAAIGTVLADARGPQLIFGAPGATLFGGYLTAVAIAAGWVGLLHPQVLHPHRLRDAIRRFTHIAH